MQSHVQSTPVRLLSHPETLAYSWSSTPAAPARAAPSEAPTRAAPSEAPASVSTPARAAPSEAPASVSTCGTPSVAAECGDLNVATPIRPHRSNASGHTPSSRRPGYDRPPSVRTPLHCRLWKGVLTISQRRCASLKAEKRELTAELRRERRRHRAEERRWRAEEKRLRTQLSDAEDAVTQLKSALGGIFSDRQLTTLRTGRRVNWEQQDIVRALVIRCCSRKCYQLLKDKFQFPLPGLSTLRRSAVQRQNLLFGVPSPPGPLDVLPPSIPLGVLSPPGSLGVLSPSGPVGAPSPSGTLGAPSPPGPLDVLPPSGPSVLRLHPVRSVLRLRLVHSVSVSPPHLRPL
ncbi:hypothetical protein FJT64_025692 [Amphibalanus amphitrite]|uniref:Uncharacterized protein n=1 Tax=Amphibalanus amphitrite TaxID=1232801 RepID=A0A6A4WED9_AMPAM|nr:hypothetical protein FJT64_025692 [Amphibalanus amphitrite]